MKTKFAITNKATGFIVALLENFVHVDLHEDFELCQINENCHIEGEFLIWDN
jgi:hypothetical protein